MVRYEVGSSTIHISYGLLKQIKHNFARSTSVLTGQISQDALYVLGDARSGKGSGHSQLNKERRSRSVSKPNSLIVVVELY